MFALYLLDFSFRAESCSYLKCYIIFYRTFEPQNRLYFSATVPVLTGFFPFRPTLKFSLYPAVVCPVKGV